jgi:glycosyltransferase involved in cell wall biosynthesis
MRVTMRVTMMVRCLAMMRGGGETRHLAWMRELKALGVEVDVITGAPLVFGHPRHPVDEVPSTVLRSPYTRDAVYRWQNRRGFGRITMTALHLDEEWFCRAAWRQIELRAERPDVVHAHALYQTARLRRADIPVVINLPGAPHARYTADLRQADALVADGWAADHLPAMLGCPVHRVPKGVDASLFCPDGPDMRRELKLEGKRVILAVGRLVPLKNVRVLLEAMRLLRAEIPTAHLLLVGEGPEREALGRHASELGIGSDVTFAGYVPQTDTPAFYRTADVFALTSDFDNSPNVVLEAMSSRLPIVSTDVGGIRDFVEHGRGGFLVAPRNAAAFAAALRAWLSSDVSRAQAGEYNRGVVLQRFSWRASAARLLDVYRNVIAARPRALGATA